MAKACVCGKTSPLPISHQELILNFMEYCLLVFLLSLLHYLNFSSEKVTYVKECFISEECNISNVLALSEFCCLLAVPAPLG